MPINSESDIWKLKEELFKDFGGFQKKINDRRKIRYRRMDAELRKLPLNPRISNTALMVYQSELPNQDAHRRTKRLIANKPKFEVVLMDSDPDAQALGQMLEDGFKALYKWMQRGKTPSDYGCVQHQQGDGIGLLKIDFLPGHGVSLADYDLDELLNGDSDTPARKKFLAALKENQNPDEAYSKITDDALSAERPPFRMSAPDPVTCAWFEDEDGVAVIGEAGKKSLNPLVSAFKDVGYSLSLNKDQGRLVVTEDDSDAVSAATTPDSGTYSKDVSQEVDYCEIRTRKKIYILLEHPAFSKVKGKKPTERGVMIDFDNPFGPYTTGYALVPGDVTTESDPAEKYQPPILGLLASAQIENTLMTAQVSASLEEALSPAYIKVIDETKQPATDESKAPDVTENREIPVVAGEIKRVETPKSALPEVERRILAEQGEYKFQEALVGEATSDTSGHRLAIQVAQADIQSVPYQNARAEAIAELMKGILYAVRSHGLPVFIPTLPDSRRKGKNLQVSRPAMLLPEMADLNFELIVTLGADTPVTKFAKWQALAQREAQGTASYMTVVEQSDVEDPEEEIARVFEGKVLKATMEQVLPAVVQAVVQMGLQKIAAVAQQGNPPMGVSPETGEAGGGGGFRAGQPSAPDNVRLPGVGMSPAGPSTDDFGPPVPEGGGEIQVRGG